MKKILAVLVTLIIVFSSCLVGLTTVASALEESPEADFMAFDGVIEEYVGPGGVVVIPQVIGGEKVTEIAARAFFGNKDITAVHIPEGVETIGYNAFQNCENLETVTLPYSLYELPASIFAGCGITEITIPGNVRYVGNWCFSGCNLTKIVISYGVEQIHTQAFVGNPGVDVVFPETVSVIGASAFGPQADSARVTYTICNPDCEVGVATKNNNVQEFEKNEWLPGVVMPIATNPHAAVNYKFIVPEDSTVYKTLKENEKTLYTQLDNVGYHDNSITLIGKKEDYFDKLKENQEDWGITEPTGEEYVPGQDTEDDKNDGSDDNDKSDKDSGSDKKGSSSGNKDTTTVIEEAGNSAIMITLIVVAAVVILIIAGLVVFVVLYTKKPKQKAPTEEEMFEKFMAKMEAKANAEANESESESEDAE